jgi:ubiquinone/menaquinone biosynthesis C-methylase UbiE
MSAKIQYGCGLCSPDDWINFDCSPTLKIERLPLLGHLIPGKLFPSSVRYGDIVKRLPVEDETADAIYCSHVLEHLALHDLRIALKNTFRILKQGGTFRLVLPDLEFYIQQYLNDPLHARAENFMRSTLLGLESRPRGVLSKIKQLYGNSKHLWMWDYEAMRIELEKTGFSHVRRAVFGDSSNSDFTEVEEESRWRNCLGLECVRLCK